MTKPWRCRMGWHQWVRRSGHDNPNHQICLACRKTRNHDTITMLGGQGGQGP